MRDRQIVEDSGSSSASDVETGFVIEREVPAAPPAAAAPSFEQIDLESAVRVLEAEVVIGRVQRSFGDGLVVEPLGALLKLGEAVFGRVEGRVVRIGSLEDVFGSLERYFYFVAFDRGLQAHFVHFRQLRELIVDAKTTKFLSAAEFEDMKRQRGSDAQIDIDHGLAVESSASEDEAQPLHRSLQLLEPGEAKRVKETVKHA